MQCISLLYQLTTFFAYERWFALNLIFCYANSYLITQDNSQAMPGNPYINLTLQLLGKNNFE